MALRSKVRLFPVGREVYYARLKDTYRPVRGTVSNVSKGVIEVSLSIGGLVCVSPSDRFLSLTETECLAICDLLNTAEKRC